MSKIKPRYPLVPPVSHVKHPGDGFYQYVNQTWLKGHHIRRWRSEFGVSDEIEDHTDTILLNILNGLDTSSIGKDPILNPKTPSDQLVLLSHIWKNRTVPERSGFFEIEYCRR